MNTLKRKRKKLGMTQEQMAKKLGISRFYYIELELERRKPAVNLAQQIAKILEFDWTTFYGENDHFEGEAKQLNLDVNQIISPVEKTENAANEILSMLQAKGVTYKEAANILGLTDRKFYSIVRSKEKDIREEKFSL